MDRDTSFELTTEPIDLAAMAAELHHPTCGALATFEGWVRNHNEGKRVARLEYETYRPMALREGARIIAEARERFAIGAARCVHRTGMLAIGDCAVWVGVSAAHRNDAFAACRYIIDEIKHRVPIWKKEHYADGDSGWINCEHARAEVGGEPPGAPSSTDYYARQMVLPEVGPEGQARLSLSRVLVVGAGGLGCGALPYIAAAGIGHLGIIDGDRVEPSNLHRQVLFGPADVGRPKAATAAARLRLLNPLIKVTAHDARVDWGNIEALLRDYDYVLDCTDNFETKYLLNDACALLGKTLITASIYQYEGQLLVLQPHKDGACLRCLWPEAPIAACLANCTEAGVLGAVPGVFGALQATETIKLLLGLSGRLENEILLFDLLTMRARRVPVVRNPACKACGAHATHSDAPPLEIDYESAIRDGFQLIDIREPEVAFAAPLARARHQAPETWLHAAPPFEPTDRVALLCERGLRSKLVAQGLRDRGYPHIYSLRGDIPSGIEPQPASTR